MTNTVVVTLSPLQVSSIGGTDNTIVDGQVTLNPTMNTVAITGTDGFYGTIAVTIPLITISTTSGIGGPDITWPMPSMDIEGTPGVVGEVESKVTIGVTIAGETGLEGAISLNLSPLQIHILEDPTVFLPIPKPTVAVQGFAGWVGYVQPNIPISQVEIGGQTQYAGGLVLVEPSVHVQIVGAVGATGAVNTSLVKIALAVNGYAGIVGSANLTIPISNFEAGSGYENMTGSVVLSIPLLVLQATGFEQTGVNASTIVMHTENQSLTTYSNYAFNSYAKFNGVYLGANGSGIFALAGDTDNGAAIAASARVGLTDFGTSHMKRVDRLYVGYRTNGDMVFRVFTDEVNQRDYLLTATGKTGLHGNHVRIGKGLAARYWQFEIENRNGSDFQMNVIEAKPTVLRRRIGGGSG